MFHVKQKLENESGSGGDGANDNWRDMLPDEIKDWNEVKEAKDADSFWNQMQNMRSFMGQSIRIPGEDASKEDKAAFNTRLQEKVPTLMPRPDEDNDEVMQAFYNQMGRPAEAKAYKVPELTAPDGIVLQEGLPESFKPIAYRHGLNQKQYEGVVKDYTNSTVEQAQAQLAEHQAGMKALNDEWGMKYDPNIEKAEAIRSKYFKDVIPNLNLAGADTIKAFTRIADRFGQEGAQELIESTRTEHSNAVAPAEAQERLTEILSNSDHAYWDAHDPAHKQAVDKVLQLTKMANPKLSRNPDNMRANVNVELG